VTVTVNGQRRDIDTETTLTDVVASLTASSHGVAVAVNGTVVPRGSWRATRVGEGDEIEILTAVQGG